MVRAIKQRATVQPGGLLEIRRPDLPTGATVEVIVMLDDAGNGASTQPPVSLGSLFGQVRGCFQSGEAADAFLRAERDEWPA